MCDKCIGTVFNYFVYPLRFLNGSENLSTGDWTLTCLQSIANTNKNWAILKILILILKISCTCIIKNEPLNPTIA